MGLFLDCEMSFKRIKVVKKEGLLKEEGTCEMINTKGDLEEGRLYVCSLKSRFLQRKDGVR